MDYAISIYKGGRRVYAKDCDFVSYSVEGLICPICKQEVYLRKGNIREPYFAHFHATSSRQIEECELRVSTDGNSTETSSLIENRGQRLDIFQQHFISMIYVGQEKIVDDIKFNTWIDSIKQSNNSPINNITNNCIEYFFKYHRQIQQIYIIPLTNIQDKQILYQQQIALEAIDYLCVKSSSKLLEYLIFYSIYKLHEHGRDKLFKQELTTKDIANICHSVMNILIFNTWIEAFSNIKINNYKSKNKPNVINSNNIKIQNTLDNTVSTLSSSNQFLVSFSILGGKKQSIPIVYMMEIVKGNVVIFYHYSEKIKNPLTKQTETIYKKRQVATINTAPGTLKIQFEQIILDKLAFGDYSFHHELLEQYALPFWITNAETYVLANKLPPVWLILSKLIQEA